MSGEKKYETLKPCPKCRNCSVFNESLTDIVTCGICQYSESVFTWNDRPIEDALEEALRLANGDIAELTGERNGLQTHVDALRAKIEELKDELTTSNNHAMRMDQDNQEKDAEIARLREQNGQLKGNQIKVKCDACIKKGMPCEIRWAGRGVTFCSAGVPRKGGK